MSFTRFKHRLSRPADEGVQETANVDQSMAQDPVDNIMIAEPTDPLAETDGSAALLAKLNAMSKTELDQYALSSHGIVLDRRKTHQRMVTDFIQALGEKN
jgi:hypothetical protein